MKKRNEVSTLVGFMIIIGAAAVLFGGIFAYQYFFTQKSSNGEPIGQGEAWKFYINTDYGFRITFPYSWKGYSVVKQKWEGRALDNNHQTYSGPLIIIKNPQTTSAQQWQDIPIMVFTPEVWNMVSGPNATVAVSAAPIGPGKIGENSRYVFATPPRWYGFTDAIGFQEALEIVKTFKAF